MNKYLRDNRIVLTLDAGGTNFVFTALRGSEAAAGPLTRRSETSEIGRSMAAVAEGFTELLTLLSPSERRDTAAISFAFPGPADYSRGIIGDLPNLPAYRGGVPLGPFLENKFGVPVFINNDGNLFALGESIAGLLPEVNSLLESYGSHKRYRNLLGITLGTGFGAGAVAGGRLITGDNSSAGEIWIMRNKLFPEYCAEASVGKDYVKRLYREYSGADAGTVPEPDKIFRIASGDSAGDRDAAVKAFKTLGTVAGDAAASASNIVDGLIVVGGGLSGAADFIFPSFIEELNGRLRHHPERYVPRMETRAFDLRDRNRLDLFLKGNEREIVVPGSEKTVFYDSMPRIGVGLSVLGTGRAVAVGAYVYALMRME